MEGSGWWVKKKETAKDGYGSVGAREDFNHFSFSQHLAWEYWWESFHFLRFLLQKDIHTDLISSWTHPPFFLWVSEWVCVRALCFVSVSLRHKKALLYYALSLSISFSGFIQKGKQRKKVKRYFFIWVDNDVVGVGVVVFLLFT